MTHLYQHIVAFAFAVKEINENQHIVSNVSLGFQLYNGYFTASWIYLASVELLSQSGQFIPNYNCDLENIPVSVIGGATYDFLFHISSILSMYKVSQVRHVPCAWVLEQKHLMTTKM